ncbi:MAG: Holliday junction resolvase RuvX [Bacteroidetes bacterium]|nr:Holliday junction resolvase RuvX [Bacteroidota bacterium]
MRILCLDYGKKRTGIAVSDPLQLIASGLKTVETKDLMNLLRDYFKQEEVAQVLIGYPVNLDGSSTDATTLVDGFIRAFQNQFPEKAIIKIDERYSSKMAANAIAGMGLRKKEKEKKGLLDEVAAVIMLQQWMDAGQ